MANDMSLTPTSFTGLPGAPFTQAEIDAAVTTVRNAAGWHIAPARSDTISLDVDWCECVLRLPTRHLVSVDEIRDTRLSTVISTSRYHVSAEFPKIHKRGGVWPHGYGRLEVDITHGYTPVPADLLPVLAETVLMARRDQAASQYAAGPYSVAYGAEDVATRTVNPLSTARTLERYSLFQMGMA